MLLPRDLLSQLCADSLYWCNRADRFVNRVHQKLVFGKSLNSWLEEMDTRQNSYTYGPNACYPTVICRWNESKTLVIKKSIGSHNIFYAVSFLFDHNRTTLWNSLESNGRWKVYSDQQRM